MVKFQPFWKNFSSFFSTSLSSVLRIISHPMSTDVISYHCNSTCGFSPVNIVGSDLVSFVHVSNCANLGFFYMYFATRPRPSQTAVTCVLMCIIIFSLISSFVQVTSCLNLFRQRLSLHATPHCGWRTRVVDSEGGGWT